MTFYERLLDELPSLREEREIGKAEGIAEGELLGMREIALQTLINRFESVPADKERLLDVATHAGTDTLEQVRARLNLSERQG